MNSTEDEWLKILPIKYYIRKKTFNDIRNNLENMIQINIEIKRRIEQSTEFDIYLRALDVIKMELIDKTKEYHENSIN
ncbi:MAG: hypothetical protein FK732_05955 [Asgard group archaeon]|jgi:hypothetical protein|nr:hypothetical protein [Asgard group archaeon]